MSRESLGYPRSIFLFCYFSGEQQKGSRVRGNQCRVMQSRIKTREIDKETFSLEKVSATNWSSILKHVQNVFQCNHLWYNNIYIQNPQLTPMQFHKVSFKLFQRLYCYLVHQMLIHLHLCHLVNLANFLLPLD